MPQIMNLPILVPGIQEEVLLLPRTDGGRAPICQHMVWPIAAVTDWHKQRRMWYELRSAKRV